MPRAQVFFENYLICSLYRLQQSGRIFYIIIVYPLSVLGFLHIYFTFPTTASAAALH